MDRYRAKSHKNLVERLIGYGVSTTLDPGDLAVACARPPRELFLCQAEFGPPLDYEFGDSRRPCGAVPLQAVRGATRGPLGRPSRDRLPDRILVSFHAS